MCGGSGATKTTSTGQANIPPELSPLITGSVGQTLDLQQLNPLSGYMGQAPQQIFGLNDRQANLINAQNDLVGLGYTAPEYGALNALGGVQANPLGFSQAQTPEGTYTAPEMVSLNQMLQSLNAPIGSAPTTVQGMEAWKKLVEPQVRNQQALQGTLYGGAADEAIANSASAAMMPLLEQEMESRSGAVRDIASLGGTAANRFRGDVQQEISNLMSTVSPLMQLGGTEAGRYRSDIAQALESAGIPREIANQQAEANYQDYLRRYGMAEKTTLGPLMEIMPNLLTQVQSSKTKGGGGGFMGSVICTELHRRGLLDDETYEADGIFGRTLPEEVMAGYHRWGIPLARAMRRSGIVTILVTPFALCWAKEMKARIKGGKGSRLGRFMLKVGIPICARLGRRQLLSDPSGAKFRRGIINLQDFMVQKIKEGVIKPGHLPLRHYFTPFHDKYPVCAYAREIFLPKGELSIGKIHKHSHLNFILKGKVWVETEFGRKYYEGPCIFVSERGLKRAVFAQEDTIWATVHLTEHRGEGNLDKIEDEVIAKTYEELDDLGICNSSISGRS